MNENYRKWVEYQELDPELKAELEKSTEAEIEDAFNGHLTFGTGGLRGIIGVGTNRINIYVIRKTTYGFLKYLMNHILDFKTRGIVIGYDSRKNSRRFAEEAACVLGTAGVKVYLAKKVTPTPQLSYSVRSLKCAGGIMITASHNPPQYNGFKVFDETGCQLLPEGSDIISQEASSLVDVFSLEVASLEKLMEKGIIEYFDNDQDYLKMVDSVQVNDVQKGNILVVYTPLHGAGALLLPDYLKDKGYNIITVPEQMELDAEFKTVRYPNPEDPTSFVLAEQLGKKYRADLLVATDADADRMGVAVLINNGYYYLSGDEIGALMLYYLAQHRKGVVMNTIVTSSIARAICEKYQIELKETLTGFKYIGTIMNEIEKEGKNFLFAYEESFGYVIKDFIRDKDAFQATLLMLEIASFYQRQGLTLVDVLELIDEEFGCYRTRHLNITLEGPSGSEKVRTIMDYFRSNPYAFNQPTWIEDYLAGVRWTNDETTKLLLPPSNVLKFGGVNWWVALRPSGTEPKMKFYLLVVGKTKDEALQLLEKLEAQLQEILATI